MINKFCKVLTTTTVSRENNEQNNSDPKFSRLEIGLEVVFLLI